MASLGTGAGSETREGPYTVSETAPVLLLKPVRGGGTAFWRVVLAALRGGVEAFEALALRLHSRAWLYVFPADVVDPSRLWGVWAAEARGLRVVDWELRRLRVKVKRARYEAWGYSYTYRYLEVCEEGADRCFEIHPNQVLRHRSTAPDTADLR